jgi:hypothetical protein
MHPVKTVCPLRQHKFGLTHAFAYRDAPFGSTNPSLSENFLRDDKVLVELNKVFMKTVQSLRQ